MRAMRFAATMACILVALDCFTKQEGTLGLPHWAWVAAGIGWLLNAAVIAIGGIK